MNVLLMNKIFVKMGNNKIEYMKNQKFWIMWYPPCMSTVLRTLHVLSHFTLICSQIFPVSREENRHRRTGEMTQSIWTNTLQAMRSWVWIPNTYYQAPPPSYLPPVLSNTIILWTQQGLNHSSGQRPIICISLKISSQTHRCMLH